MNPFYTMPIPYDVRRNGTWWLPGLGTTDVIVPVATAFALLILGGILLDWWYEE